MFRTDSEPFPTAELCRFPPGSKEGNRFTQYPLLVYDEVEPWSEKKEWMLKKTETFSTF